MPSISKARLDEMAEELKDANEAAAANLGDAHRAEARVRQFDNILDAILRAANGQSLLTRRDDRLTGGYAMTPGYPSDMRYVEPCGHQRGPTEDERHQQQVGELNARIVGLECRLSAVIAAAEFAKEHKA